MNEGEKHDNFFGVRYLAAFAVKGLSSVDHCYYCFPRLGVTGTKL